MKEKFKRLNPSLGENLGRESSGRRKKESARERQGERMKEREMRLIETVTERDYKLSKVLCFSVCCLVQGEV